MHKKWNTVTIITVSIIYIYIQLIINNYYNNSAVIIYYNEILIIILSQFIYKYLLQLNNLLMI